MTKKMRISHAPGRSAVFIATVAAALFATTQFASAKKPDAAVTTAVTNASNIDIEEIVESGITVGNQIATGAIKLSTTNVNALVRGLADAIIAKQATTQTPDPNRLDNKVDEIGEVAAFVFHSVSQSTKIRSDKKGLGQAKKYASAVIKSALKTAIKSSAFLSTDIVTDVVGSVALTIHNDTKFDLYESKLQKALVKSAASLAGRSNKATVINALNAGFAGDAAANAGFEDGNIAELATIADPETDFRNS